jgi:hypothetical protein
LKNITDYFHWLEKTHKNTPPLWLGGAGGCELIIWYRIKEIFPWVIGAFVVLSSNWAANTLQDTIKLLFGESSVEISWIGLFNIVFFLIMVILLYKERTAFFQPRTRFMKGESPEKRQHLVLFLSELNTKVNLSEGIPSEITLDGNFEKDLDKLVAYKKNKPFWRWEMPLRAIRHHVGKLESITIICSSESIKQVDWFRNVLRKYSELNELCIQCFIKENNRPIFCTTYETNKHSAWNFEEFDDLSRALLHLLRAFQKLGIPEKEIMIDFTGGQKVTSVVAAAITFNRNVKAQYVQTNEPWKVLSYDILLGSDETGGLGI